MNGARNVVVHVIVVYAFKIEKESTKIQWRFVCLLHVIYL